MQSISRAELCGALAAIKWTLQHQTEVHLWSDSKYVVDGIQAILDGRWQVLDALCENHDLWHQIGAHLADLPVGLFQASWIPYHLDYTICTTDI